MYNTYTSFVYQSQLIIMQQILVRGDGMHSSGRPIDSQTIWLLSKYTEYVHTEKV